MENQTTIKHKIKHKYNNKIWL